MGLGREGGPGRARQLAKPMGVTDSCLQRCSGVCVRVKGQEVFTHYTRQYVTNTLSLGSSLAMIRAARQTRHRYW